MLKWSSTIFQKSFRIISRISNKFFFYGHRFVQKSIKSGKDLHEIYMLVCKNDRLQKIHPKISKNSSVFLYFILKK